jgi:hypothetical protein
MTDAPNTAIAGDLATAAVGRPPIKVRRFSTGAHHYVFEATFADRPPVVVRVAAEHSMARSLTAMLCPRRQTVETNCCVSSRMLCNASVE